MDVAGQLGCLLGKPIEPSMLSVGCCLVAVAGQLGCLRTWRAELVAGYF